MILKYKTGKLPLNFIYLGIMLFGIGMWRMIVLDWRGILFFVISLLFLFLKSGIIIDTDNRRLKKYIGIFAIRKGKWKFVETKSTQIACQIDPTKLSDVCLGKLESESLTLYGGRPH